MRQIPIAMELLDIIMGIITGNLILYLMLCRGLALALLLMVLATSRAQNPPRLPTNSTTGSTCTKDSDCMRNQTVRNQTGAVGGVAQFTPPEVGRICVTNSAGFVLHFDMKDLDNDEISPDSGTYPIDQTKCQVLSDIAHISGEDLIMCRVHAVAGETKDCGDAVKYKVNSSETATFVCEGTTLDYSCKLE
jgi:hypothetical protein